MFIKQDLFIPIQVAQWGMERWTLMGFFFMKDEMYKESVGWVKFTKSAYGIPVFFSFFCNEFKLIELEN